MTEDDDDDDDDDDRVIPHKMMRMNPPKRARRQRRNKKDHVHVPSLLLLLLQQLVLHVLFLLAVFSTAASTTTTAASTSCLPFSLLHMPDTSNYNHRPRPLIIAHRGASFSLPEHTLPAYRLGLELQADYIELDLVASQDGVLFALHTVDLNVTTNVEDMFSVERQTWSRTVNRTGFWSFQFTAAELEQLTVQQRLPAARSARFDGMFRIPRLEHILVLLVQEWNTKTLPQLLPKSYPNTTRTTTTTASTSTTPNEDENNSSNNTHGHRRRPTQLQLRQAGLYAEFKDFNWILQEAGLNLVDLLLQHMQDFADLWKPLLEEKCFSEVRFDEYNKPGLIVESFDVEALQEFSQKWTQYFTAEPVNDNHDDDDDDDTAKNNKTKLRQAPQPPAILLVDQHICHNEEFWYHVGNTWRGVVQGLGCEKSCLLSSSSSSSGSNHNNINNEKGKEFRARAAEFQLALHPWTERPEQEFLQQQQQNSAASTSTTTTMTTAPIFDTVLDETRYMFCQLQVEGIFTESVATAVMAAHMPCDDFDADAGAVEPTTAPIPTPNQGTTTSSSMCYESEQEANLYTNVASFVMGLFVATFLSVWMHRKRRRRYGDGRAVPTAEAEDETAAAAAAAAEQEEYAVNLELT